MADNSSGRNHPRRSRSRKVDGQPERRPIRHLEPDLGPSNAEYTFDQPYPQHDLSAFRDIGDDALMQQYYRDLGYGFNMNMEGPVKDNSATTTTGSIVSIESPSVVTENGSGSFIVVNHRQRTYSYTSNRTSGGSSDGRNFSTPDDAEWNQAAPIPSVETLEEDALLRPHYHDPEYILSNMGSDSKLFFCYPFNIFHSRV
jgi:hypothetical protein